MIISNVTLTIIIGPLTSPSSPSVRFTAFDDPIITNIINTKKSPGPIYT